MYYIFCNLEDPQISLNLYRFMMKNNLLPRSEMNILDNDKINLETNLLGKSLKHPIGLASGIDLTGNCVESLNNLGFEFIEIGPLIDQFEDETIISPKQKKAKILFNDVNTSFYFIQHNPFVTIDYAMVYLQSLSFKKSNNELINHRSLINTNLQLSTSSAKTVPYMADSIFIKMINTSLFISDFTTINLTHNLACSQYKNKEKFDIFLNKIKDSILYDIGIREIINYEENKISTNEHEFHLLKHMFNAPIKIIRKDRSRILLRLDPGLKENEIKSFIESSINSGVVDGIIIGGAVRGKHDNSEVLITGDTCKEKSLEALKIANKYNKGKLALISTGGVLNGEDIYTRICNGADLVLIFSSFLYLGPYCLETLIPQLKKKMTEENVISIEEIKSKRIF
jgi:hypothetical protein